MQDRHILGKRYQLDDCKNVSTLTIGIGKPSIVVVRTRVSALAAEHRSIALALLPDFLTLVMPFKQPIGDVFSFEQLRRLGDFAIIVLEQLSMGEQDFA